MFDLISASLDWLATVPPHRFWQMAALAGALILLSRHALLLTAWRRFAGAMPAGYLLWVMGLAIVLAPFWAGFTVMLFITALSLLSDLVMAEGAARRDTAYPLGVTLTGLAAFLAAPLVLIRTYVAERQAKTVEQGHITDRFTKAVEQLGAEKTMKRTVPREETDVNGNASIVDRVIEETVPNLEVRLGAIYALERIAQDSERDHIPIMETLCAYIRENAVAHVDDEGTVKSRRKQPEAPEVFHPPRADVQTALTVIGRRAEARLAYEDGKKFRLDLSITALPHVDLTEARLGSALLEKVNLQEAELVDANLQGAMLAAANLQWARLWDAKLQWAVLVGANLQGAQLADAKLQGAELMGANLQGASFFNANLKGAGLTGANLQWAVLIGANLQGAQLGGANLQGAKLMGANFNTADLRDWSMARTSLRSAVLKEAKNLSAESVRSAFGVKRGIGLTILPESMAPPDHWHEAEDTKQDSSTAKAAYERAYLAWLDTQPTSPSPSDPA